MSNIIQTGVRLLSSPNNVARHLPHCSILRILHTIYYIIILLPLLCNLGRYAMCAQCNILRRYILYNIRIARENANICIAPATHAPAPEPPRMSVVPLGPTGMVKCPNYITDKNNGNKYQILSVEYKKRNTTPCSTLSPVVGLALLTPPPRSPVASLQRFVHTLAYVYYTPFLPSRPGHTAFYHLNIVKVWAR